MKALVRTGPVHAHILIPLEFCRMDSNKQQYNGSSSSSQAEELLETISVEQLQHLVGLLDRSDISELEIKSIGQGTRLLLRKAKLAEGQVSHELVLSAQAELVAVPKAVTEQKVLAPLVGIFHVWAKPKGGTLVAVGDHVKTGKLLATIQSLNLINEVEAPTGGRVTEILVQDGQPVEYGQPLMIIDSKEEPN